MDNVMDILEDRSLGVKGLLDLILDRHPDCGLTYPSLRRLCAHERTMSIDDAILICDALDVPFVSLFGFSGELSGGPLKGMTSVDVCHALEQKDSVQPVISKCKSLRFTRQISLQVLIDGSAGIAEGHSPLKNLRINNPQTLRSLLCIEAILHAAALSKLGIRTCREWASSPSHATTVADIIRKARNHYSDEERKQVNDILMFLDSKDAIKTWHTIEKAFGYDE